jgi:hypothetical protein
MRADALIARLAALPPDAEIVISEVDLRPDEPDLRPARLVRAFFQGKACGVSIHNPTEPEYWGAGSWRYEYLDGWAI